MKYNFYKDKQFLNTNELLHYLNVSRSTLYRLIKTEVIVPYKIDENMKGRNLYKFEEVKKVYVRVSKTDFSKLI